MPPPTTKQKEGGKEGERQKRGGVFLSSVEGTMNSESCSDSNVAPLEAKCVALTLLGVETVYADERSRFPLSSFLVGLEHEGLSVAFSSSVTLTDGATPARVVSEILGA